MESDTERTPGTSYVDDLARLEAATSAELARIDQAYREIQRRDGAAWWHARGMRRFAYVLIAGLLLSVGYNMYQAHQASQVQAFVQVVQNTEEGRLVQVGVPLDLLAYTPEQGQWMEMLAAWVQKRYWRGDEATMTRAKLDWVWLAHHSCGQAATDLQAAEKVEGPGAKPGLLRSVEVETVTKTYTPESYQVKWYAQEVEKGRHTTAKVSQITTFTVGRVRPKTMEAMVANRLGLCVTGFNSAPAPSGRKS